MSRIELKTWVHAPPEIVFDLSRSLDVHVQGQASHRERAVGQRKTGLLGLDEQVTWSAIHFGIRQKLTSRMVAMSRPHYFRDSQVAGAFRRFDHDHYFEGLEGGTRMRDVFDFDSPWGFFGRLVDRLYLKAYMRRLLLERNDHIKRIAESGEWRNFLGLMTEP